MSEGMRHRARRGLDRGRLLGLSVTCVTLLLAGCGSSDDVDGANTDDTAESLLASAPASQPAAKEEAATREASSQGVDIEHLGFNFGDEDAVVRVVELSDFGCGFCRKFHMETWPTLKKEFVETGKVQWKYVPYILGIFPHALEAAHAGECAGEQGKFTEMSGRLFADQADWKKSSEPEAVFRRFAKEEGLDTKRFKRCVDEGWRTKRIQAGSALGRQVGVRGTPTFFVVGYAPLQGALDVDTFRQVLNMVYEDQLQRQGGSD